MEKMAKLNYLQLEETEKNTNEVTFSLKPLERGFGNTLGVALRRVLLSNITSLALFAIKIEGVEHEFQVIPGVHEDVTALIMNLRKVKFAYNSSVITDGDIIKVSLNVDEAGDVTSRSLEVTNSSVEILNKTLHLATVSQGSKHGLHLEMYLRPGRGFVSNEENKLFISNPQLFTTKAESSLKKGIFIATDSNFSPIENVEYHVNVLNTGSTKIEEELNLTIRTNGSIDPKAAIEQACDILVAHFKLIGNVDEMKLDIFKEEEQVKTENEVNDIDINSIGLSVRSLNALRKINKLTLREVAQMTYDELEQTKNLGKKSIDEIVAKLQEFGYSLSKGDE